MAKEVYRSFNGKLNCNNQSGYIITELKDFYEIEFLSVLQSGYDKVRIYKHLLSKNDFSNFDKIANLAEDIDNGNANYGQCWYKDKWYSYDVICKIQEKYKVNNWKSVV